MDNCDCDAEGYETVLKALQTMKNMAQKINEVQHQKERKIRFGELQLLLFELPVSGKMMDWNSKGTPLKTGIPKMDFCFLLPEKVGRP